MPSLTLSIQANGDDFYKEVDPNGANAGTRLVTNQAAVAIGPQTNDNGDWYMDAYLRFSQGGLPAGAVISSATLRIQVTLADLQVNNTWTTTIRGHKATSAAAPASVAAWDAAPTTTASDSWLMNFTTTGQRDVTVTNAVQELCNQGGWSGSSPIALFLIDPKNTAGSRGNDVVTWRDFSFNAGASASQLLITYTDPEPPDIYTETGSGGAKVAGTTIASLNRSNRGSGGIRASGQATVEASGDSGGSETFPAAILDVNGLLSLKRLATISEPYNRPRYGRTLS